MSEDPVTSTGGTGLAEAGRAAREHHLALAVTTPSLVVLVTLTAVCALRSGWEIWHTPAIGPAEPAG